MKFGEVETTEVIDDQGSTKTHQVKFHNAKPTPYKRVRYKKRKRANSEKEGVEIVFTMVSELLADPLKKDVAIEIERPAEGRKHGYFNVVECYTLLEY